MPASEPAIFADQNLRLLRISDFSPGIHQRGQASQTVTQSLQGVDTMPAFTSPFAPLGSASSAFRCINEPGVGLVPLPTYVNRFAHVNPSAVPRASPSQPLVVLGIGCFGEIGPVGQEDSIFVTLGYEFSATQRNHDHIRLDSPITNPVATQLATDNIVGSVGVYFGRTWTKTRVTYTAGGQQFAQPCMVVNNPENNATQGLLFSPNPNNNTQDTFLLPLPAVPGSAAYAWAIIGHEFRIVVLTSVFVGYQWGTAPGGASTSFFNFGEDILYTDPPETTTFVTFAGTVIPHFDPENMSGWGAWGSINSGELVLIRVGGGAVLLSGDMSQPNVTKLPGVVGTGHTIGAGAMTGGGLYYLSEFDGCYVWNGSNTSQKVSSQIPDDALMRTHAIVASSYPGVTLAPVLTYTNTHITAWGDWVLFAHNWLYDTKNGSWWRIQDPAVDDFELFQASQSYRRYCYAMPGYVNNPTISNGPKLVAFDRLARQTTWRWVSNPISPVVGSLVDIGWIEIMASNPTASPATITVTAASVAGSETDTVSFTIPANTTAIRLGQRAGFKNYTVILTVNAANNNVFYSGPILHELSIGYLADTAPTALT